ncbi:MAG: hypothetical protein J6J00_11955 [Treponema sp.]|nr:hypothetical protein [Treponema sp.]
MGKKVNLMSWLYCCGMLITAIGFCCPMIKGLFGSSANGFDFIKNIEDGGFVAIGALLIFVGAVAGIVAQFVPQLKGLKLIFLLVSIAGGVILVIGFLTNGGIYKAIGKQLLKRALFGFYLVIVGWIVACVGYFSKK